jgi:hypothetical protein
MENGQTCNTLWEKVYEHYVQQKNVVCKFFFAANICHLETKKKGLANPTKGFLRFLKKISHISKQKIKIAIFR